MYYFCVIILDVIIRYILINKISIIKIAYYFLCSIPTFSMTFMGLNYSTMSLYVGNTWYLSIMMISIFILYPLLLRNYNYSVKILFPFLTVVILGYLYSTNGAITIRNGEWSGFAYYGVLRAIAETALGCSLFQLSKTIIERKPLILYSTKITVKTLLTVFKLFCYSVVVIYGFGSFMGIDFPFSFDLHALFFCSIGILFSFSNVGFCIPDYSFTRYLGKISLPIFIFHGFIRYTIVDIVGDSVSNELIIAFIIISIVGSVILMYCIDYIWNRLKRNVK